MPIYKAKIEAGSQFTAADATTGLFDPGNRGNTGNRAIQTRVNSFRFHSEGAAHTFELRTQDPDPAPGANTPLIVNEGDGGSVNDLTIEGMILATNDNGDSWPLLFTTLGMTGDGWLTIDYDFIATEG